jgi:imidazolonepropionase
MSSLLIDNIGQLVTNDPTAGQGPLGVLTDASIVLEDDRVVSVGSADRLTDKRIDAEGACVIPGFVDSHSHLVFAGDRAAEFTSRMAGKPYSGAGIAVTTNATRAASQGILRDLTQARITEARASGTTTIEIKSGYGLTTESEVLSLEVAGEFTDEVTFLGAHIVPQEFTDDTDGYVDLVCGEMLNAAAPKAKWIDVFCETGAFSADQSRRILRAGKAAGLGLRVHGNQLGHGPGVQVAVEEGAASVDHCTYLADDDIAALANSDTVATFLPATDFSTRQPYPDARRAIDAGVSVALAANCNPGSSYTTSIPFCIALAVRDMHMTVEEAIAAATIGGANALLRTDVGRLIPGSAGHALILEAPSYHHLAYRPGVQLIRKTIAG